MADLGVNVTLDKRGLGVSASASAVAPPGSIITAAPASETAGHWRDAYLNVSYAGSTTHVAAGGNLATAISGAAAGAVITLEAGATYTGNFTINKPLTLTTQNANLGTDRAVVGDIPALATVQTTNASAAVTVTGNNVVLRQLHLSATADCAELVRHGTSAETTTASMPDYLTIDQCVLAGWDTNAVNTGLKRGVGANGKHLTVRRSTIRRCIRYGADAQAICGWNSPGPFTIDDNYLEASGEVVMFGGSTQACSNVVPSNISITNNHICKDPAWQANTSITVKNLVEFKNAQHVVVRDNTMEYTWLGGQGYGFPYTPTNSDQAGASWVIVDDILFERNACRFMPGGLNLNGWTQHPTYPTQHGGNFTFRDNWFVIDRATYGGQGWFIFMARSPVNVVVEYNTVEMNGDNFLRADPYATGYVPTGFVFRGNLISTTGAYGCTVRWGSSNVNFGGNFYDYFPGGVCDGNAFVGTTPNLATNLPGVGTPNLFRTPAQVAGLIVNGYGTGALAGYGRRA